MPYGQLHAKSQMGGLDYAPLPRIESLGEPDTLLEILAGLASMAACGAHGEGLENLFSGHVCGQLLSPTVIKS